MAGKEAVKTGGIFAAIAALVVHFSGALYGVEHDALHMPWLAKFSTHLVTIGDHVPTDAVSAAVKGIKLGWKGADSDKIAAQAACTAMGIVLKYSPDHRVTVDDIYAQIPTEDRTLPGVSAAVNKLATTIQGVSAPGGLGRVYRSACFSG